VNASFGHDAGDRALRAVAECLRRSLREGDLACRYGGEEFIVILSGTAAEGQAAAERIRRRVADLPPVAAGAGTITCSIGVAGFPDHASTADSLLKAADEALLSAKHAGRDRVCLFQPGPWELGPDQIERLGSGLQGAGQDAIRALITAIDLRDRFTAAHCQRVGRLAVSLGETLGCSLDELEVLRAGAPLIDVGKIGLPDYLLAKAGRLTRPEWELMRQHPIWGEQLVKCSSLPRDALQVVRWHHERLDGSGYPDGLTAARLPLVVRIAAVADVATALREDRPHREAWPRARVLQYLRRTAGKRFDADVVEAFCRL
jgi:HD-GYP domain-containing protein (c-di-GMP phosphodiesterase class II)